MQTTDGATGHATQKIPCRVVWRPLVESRFKRRSALRSMSRTICASQHVAFIMQTTGGACGHATQKILRWVMWRPLVESRFKRRSALRSRSRLLGRQQMAPLVRLPNWSDSPKCPCPVMRCPLVMVRPLVAEFETTEDDRSRRQRQLTTAVDSS